MKNEKLIIEACGHFLSQDNVLEAYQILLDQSDSGNGDDYANNHVTPWQPFEHETVENLLNMIDDHVLSLQRMILNVLNIDWNMLKEQKSDLLQTINDLDYDAKEANSAGEEELSERLKKQSGSIQGIVNMIDNIQDLAVDSLNVPENVVFDLDEELEF